MKPSHFQQKIYETSSNVVWDSSVLWHTSYEIKVYNLIIHNLISIFFPVNVT